MVLARAKPLKELSSGNDNADELVVNWLAWKLKAADDLSTIRFRREAVSTPWF